MPLETRIIISGSGKHRGPMSDTLTTELCDALECIASAYGVYDVIVGIGEKDDDETNPPS